MACTKKDPEPIRYAVIKSGKKVPAELETWRYWEIVGALQWMGAARQTAYDAAKWIIKAKAGDTKEIEPEISIEIRQTEEPEETEE